MGEVISICLMREQVEAAKRFHCGAPARFAWLLTQSQFDEVIAQATVDQIMIEDPSLRPHPNIWVRAILRGIPLVVVPWHRGKPALIPLPL